MKSTISQRVGEETPEVLLAKINVELERISDHQHRLARRKALLREQATRLRLGVSVAEVRAQIGTHFRISQ